MAIENIPLCLVMYRIATVLVHTILPISLDGNDNIHIHEYETNNHSFFVLRCIRSSYSLGVSICNGSTFQLQSNLKFEYEYENMRG